MVAFGTGAVYILSGPNAFGQWVSLSVLTASDGETGDQFGYAVDISGDRLVVGARSKDCYEGDNCGKVYIYTTPDNGNSWSDPYTIGYRSENIIGDLGYYGAYAYVGRSVAIDGNVMRRAEILSKS